MRFLTRVATFLAAGFVASCQSGGEMRDRQIDHLAIRPAEAAQAPAARLYPQNPITTKPRFRPPKTQLFRGASPTSTRVAGRHAADSQGEPISLNFVDADVREVVKSVLGDILQENYTIDPGVSGSVTLQTAAPIPPAAALDVLEKALRANGVVMVKADSFYRITPFAEGLRYALQADGDAGSLVTGAGFGIQVIPLRHVTTEQVEAMLRSMAPEGSVIGDKARNIVLLSGTPSDLRAMSEMVRLLDVNRFAGMSFGLFYPRNADAASLAQELEQIFAVGNVAAPAIRFVALERLNAVIGVSADYDLLRAAAEWVDQLDQVSEIADERIYVYYPQNGRASDLASVLTRLLSVPNGQKTPEGRDLRSFAPPQSGAGGKASDWQADTAGISLPGQFSGRLMSDDTNNALLILSTPREYQIIEAALQKLDIPPLQVLIEAVVAEVTLNDELRYGVQWFFQSGESTIRLTEAASGVVAPAFPGFSAVLANGNDVRVVLQALERVTDVNVVSSPQMMVLNHQTATLLVGDSVPIATQSAVSVVSPEAPIVNTIQYKDTGVILTVTPRVNEGGLVFLDVTQEVSEVASTTSSDLNSPTIQQRKLQTSVSVQSHQTIALGGLIRSRREQGTGGVPLLREIPVLGEAFKFHESADRRTELLILITPRVVRSSSEIRHVTEELRDRLRFLSP